YNRLAQSGKFVIDFLKFALRIRLRNNSGSRLTDQLSIVTEECPDHDGVVECSTKPQIANSSPVEATVYILVPVDYRHGHVFWRSRQRTGREGIGCHAHNR